MAAGGRTSSVRLKYMDTYQMQETIWARSQLLLTQDAVSIPLTNSSIQLVSVSKGMHPDHARSLLTLLSEVSDGEMEDEVARTLKYQPLALASVSIYVREVRKSKVSVSFGWGD